MSTLQEIEAAIEKLPARDLRKLTEWINERCGKRSAYDAMRHGCGIVKEAPRDLGSNKKHLAGLGR
jgi:hypothetical protein